jgi:hypothetical protein
MPSSSSLPKFKKMREPDLWLQVAITRWTWDYSLFLSHLRDDNDPLSELRGIQVFGTTTVKGTKGELHVRISLLEAPGFREEKRSGREIPNVGRIDRIKGGFEGAIGVPDDVIPMILTMLAGWHFRRLQLGLWREGPRHYEIMSYGFHKSISDDD